MNIKIIFKCLLADISEQTGVFIDSPDDLSDEWLLNTAPALNKDMLTWIERIGYKVLPLSQSETKEDLNLPLFPEWLAPLWERFLYTNEARALGQLIQILVFCYKIEYEPTKTQTTQTFESFVDVDRSLKVWGDAFTGETPFWRRARDYISHVIYAANWEDITPAHGPGSVYPNRDPWERGFFSTNYVSLTDKYPICDYFAPLHYSWGRLCSPDCKFMSENEDLIKARLTCVPKDSRGPRTICVHPAEAIWIQQGQRRELQRCIARSAFRGFINFEDQSINAKLALDSSLDRLNATIDLKEASDRIHKKLVRYLFGDYVYEILSCSRASHVIIGNTEVELEKWAPMGNCLTFPVESLVFYSLVRAGIDCEFGIREGSQAAVFVYGDDIIVPNKYYDCAIRALVRAGLIPNQNKCFTKGFYRESCGVEAYRGFNITPLRMKKYKSSLAEHALGLCDLAKALRLRGLERTASCIYSSLNRSWGILPQGNDVQAVGLYEYVPKDLIHLLTRGTGRIRFNRYLHRWEVQIRQLKSRKDPRPMGGWNHLLDSLLRIRGDGE